MARGQDCKVDHSFASLYHEPHGTDVVFGRRRRRTSHTQIVSQIRVTTFEFVKPVTNSGKKWRFFMKDLPKSLLRRPECGGAAIGSDLRPDCVTYP
ncbi:hypothetical protein EVAR_22970_1 [Eumeta japonica]|uniref:Uncharacterized protein n=1 Tax=Eumeta variegata TaxID=151549 RepID=A0A4C1UR52_EUMVA|nr:hypothetical protein EVAR_22970_1 [Eumeta japonica]